MARYAIYAYDNYYGGYHGMYSKTIERCNGIREADALAREESLDIIDEYPAIQEYIEQEIASICYYSGWDNVPEGPIYDDIRNDVCNGDVAFEVFEINEDVASNYSDEELTDMFCNDDDFVEKFCLN